MCGVVKCGFEEVYIFHLFLQLIRTNNCEPLNHFMLSLVLSFHIP